MTDAVSGMDAVEREARIARMQEETRKFVAEQHKLFAEQSKLSAEQSKLFAEAMKPRRDHGLAPLVLAIAGVAGCAGFIAAFVTVLKAFGRL